MEQAAVVKKANDALNAPLSQIKEFYPYISEVFVEPLGSVSCRYDYDGESEVKCELYDCVFYVHLSVPFSEFYKEFVHLYKNKFFSMKLSSPLDEFLFTKYQIDVPFLISYYCWRILKGVNIFFNNSNFKVIIYSSDGKEVSILNKVFPK